MNLLIEYYSGEQKLSAVLAPPSLSDAVRAARVGLVQHNARYAHIIDLNKGAAPVEMVHREVRP